MTINKSYSDTVQEAIDSHITLELFPAGTDVEVVDEVKKNIHAKLMNMQQVIQDQEK